MKLFDPFCRKEKIEESGERKIISQKEVVEEFK